MMKNKLNKTLIEEEQTAIYRMFTNKGVDNYMRLAEFYHSDPNILRKIIVNIGIFFVDSYDCILYKLKRMP